MRISERSSPHALSGFTQRSQASAASRRKLRRRTATAEDIQPAAPTNVLGLYTVTLGAGPSGVVSYTSTASATASPTATTKQTQLSIGLSMAILGALFVMLGIAYWLLMLNKRRDRTSKDSRPSFKSQEVSRTVSAADDKHAPTPPRTPSPDILYLHISPANVPPEFGDIVPPVQQVRQGIHWKAIQDRWPGSRFARDRAVLETIPGSPTTPTSRRREILSIHSALSLGGLTMTDERRDSRMSTVSDGSRAARLSASHPGTPLDEC